MPGTGHSASGFDRIEVIPRVERCGRWNLHEKLKAVEESRLLGMSVSYVARKYGVASNLLSRWRKLMAERGQEAARSDDAAVPRSHIQLSVWLAHYLKGY